MSRGGFLVEVKKGDRAVTATLLLPSEVTGGTDRIFVASISRSLWETHSQIERIFNEHVRQLVGVIVESFGGVVDAMVKVPDGADLDAFVAETVAATAPKGH